MEELASVMREQEFGGTFRLPKTVNAAVDSEQWDIDYDYDAYAYGNALENVRVELARLGKGEPENEDDNYEYYEFSDDGDKQEVEGAFEAALIDNR